MIGLGLVGINLLIQLGLITFDKVSQQIAINIFRLVRTGMQMANVVMLYMFRCACYLLALSMSDF
jgi:hypothetical protein